MLISTCGVTPVVLIQFGKPLYQSPHVLNEGVRSSNHGNRGLTKVNQTCSGLPNFGIT